jgi:hypothetical protein
VQRPYRGILTIDGDDFQRKDAWTGLLSALASTASFDFAQDDNAE